MSNILLVIFSMVFFLWGCTQYRPGEAKNFPIKTYLAELPEKESINASIYNYEIILARVKREYENKNYQGVLTNYDFYLKTFTESPVDNESEINYWVGMAILNSLNDENIINRLSFADRLMEEPRKQVNYSLKVNQKDDQLEYDKSHLKKIILDRNDFFFEKKALREIYLDNLKRLSQHPSNKKAIHDENLKYFRFLATRYPDFIPYQEFNSLLTNEDYLDPQLLSRRQKEVLKNLRAILAKVNPNSYEPMLLDESIYFSTDETLIVRSRPHEIASRNIARIELWQPFKITHFLTGEDEQKWYWVEYQENRRGFVKLNEKQLKIYSPKIKVVRNYFELYNLYGKGGYLEVVEGISKMLNKQELFLKERSLVFLEKTLGKIGRRATSKENPFTKFALKYPKYFYLYEKEWYLKSSDSLLFLILELNPKTSMLQYFDGFDIYVKLVNEKKK